MVLLEEVNNILCNVIYYFNHYSFTKFTSGVYSSVVERRRVNYYSPVVSVLRTLFTAFV
jgi:hypothetical protein